MRLRRKDWFRIGPRVSRLARATGFLIVLLTDPLGAIHGKRVASVETAEHFTRE